jgi:hypothetical protein
MTEEKWGGNVLPPEVHFIMRWGFFIGLVLALMIWMPVEVELFQTEDRGASNWIVDVMVISGFLLITHDLLKWYKSKHLDPEEE